MSDDSECSRDYQYMRVTLPVSLLANIKHLMLCLDECIKMDILNELIDYATNCMPNGKSKFYRFFSDSHNVIRSYIQCKMINANVTDYIRIMLLFMKYYKTRDTSLLNIVIDGIRYVEIGFKQHLRQSCEAIREIYDKICEFITIDTDIDEFFKRININVVISTLRKLQMKFDIHELCITSLEPDIGYNMQLNCGRCCKKFSIMNFYLVNALCFIEGFVEDLENLENIRELRDTCICNGTCNVGIHVDYYTPNLDIVEFIMNEYSDRKMLQP